MRFAVDADAGVSRTASASFNRLPPVRAVVCSCSALSVLSVIAVPRKAVVLLRGWDLSPSRLTPIEMNYGAVLRSAHAPPRPAARPRARPVRGRGRPGAAARRPGTTWRAGDLALSPVTTGPRRGSPRSRPAWPCDSDEGSPRSLRLRPPRPGPRRQPGRGRLVSATGSEPARRRCVPRPAHAAGHRPPAPRAPRDRPCPSAPPGWTPSATGGRRAERAAYDPGVAVAATAGRAEPGLADLVARLVGGLDDTDDADLGREQLVHRDLAGNVLLDASGVPFVIDFSHLALTAVGGGRPGPRRRALARCPDRGAGGVAERRATAGDAPRRALPGALGPALRRRSLRRPRPRLTVTLGAWRPRRNPAPRAGARGPSSSPPRGCVSARGRSTADGRPSGSGRCCARPGLPRDGPRPAGRRRAVPPPRQVRLSAPGRG